MLADNRNRSDRSVRSWRMFLGAALLLIGAGLWLGPEGVLTPVRAQLPNPASQRLELVHEVRRTNELLAEILQHLKTGELHVRLEGADNLADTLGGAANPGRHSGD